ncbi:orotate phosphoribosyltransferase [Lacicoccus qingdaonensis]|uniref:Orotate phosphoribosyltransferase n=1 Tax=Lacicoccus qingdaonensis TaxID=576118 RepID=A0A1G9A453_9BACL|nr:orotate phosphoribosyltransferase [Salinicoccus qingdaonensis]SDK22118.1 orotate phosphoribosyltransferase [Salinicoccus qingdaonensis]
MSSSENVAKALLDIGAVKIQPDDPFTWASGIISPIYCDNRQIIGNVEARKEIVKYFVEKIEKISPDAEVVAGTSTAGIPHASFISDAMELPMSYVRGSKKKHGTGRLIEGASVKGKKVVLIEDLISTGGSSIEAAEILREEGAEVEIVLAIFSYQLEKAHDNFESSGFKYETLSDLDALLDVSIKENLLTKEERSEVVQFRDSL